MYYYTVGPQSSEPWTVVVTVTGVCCIRVFQHSSVYKSIGFIHPSKFTYLYDSASTKVFG